MISVALQNKQVKERKKEKVYNMSLSLLLSRSGAPLFLWMDRSFHYCCHAFNFESPYFTLQDTDHDYVFELLGILFRLVTQRRQEAAWKNLKSTS
jgi:hypothetical protein